MNSSISFNITKQEVQQKTRGTLTQRQLSNVLRHIENDPVLWDAIDQAIGSAVQEVRQGTDF